MDKNILEEAMVGDPRNRSNIPPALIEGLNLYAEQGVPLGSFLRAVVANDFLDAVARADEYSMRALPAVAWMVYQDLPCLCHGSRKVYKAWCAFRLAQRGGTEGDELQAKADKVSEAKREAIEWGRS